MDDEDRTASLMTPAKLAQVKPRVPVAPTAWLHKMAADAGHQHVSRLAELRDELQAHALKRNLVPVAGNLARLSEALPQLDFGLLQQKRGLLARLSGKSKSNVSEFGRQYDRIDEAIETLQAQAKLLQSRQTDQASRTDITLLEFEVEFRALEKIIDSASRWLADMRTQLKSRGAQSHDEAARQELENDAERCQLLVARLKLLRALSTAAHELHQQAQAVASRRATLVKSLQGTVSMLIREWRGSVLPLASAAREGSLPPLSLEGPMDSHRELQLGIKQAGADCAQMQAHEQELSDKLGALGAQLGAAA